MKKNTRTVIARSEATKQSKRNNFFFKIASQKTLAMTVISFLFLSLTVDSQLPTPNCYAEEEPISEANSQNKISLDIKGMDIVDVLKILAQRAGLNIVIGKNVTGRVTLFLKEVDTWDAFEIILASNELAYDKKGDIINISTQRDYELLYGERYQDKKKSKLIQLKYAKAADLSRALNQIKTNIGKIVADEASNTIILIDTPEKIIEMESFVVSADLPIETKVFSLNYTQADKLSPKLQETLTKGVGSLKIDERTNKIAITDYPEKIIEFANIIKEFDEKTLQVLIDAQIIELKPSDKFQMGVDWDYWIKKHFDIKASLPINSSNTLFFGTTTAAPAKVGQYKAIVDILRTIGDTKILSSPRIMALNNQEAKILVGTKDAYITSTTSQGASTTTVTSQTVNFVDVGIKLFVTPTINHDGFVTMKIKPEISSAERTSITSENQITQVPIVTTSESETTVMVKDGVTIIMGGLRKDTKEKTIKKIPLLGDIPLLGKLFRSTSDEDSKNELIILLTPHIMSGEDAFTDFSDLTPREGATFKMEKGEIIKELHTQNQQSSTTINTASTTKTELTNIIDSTKLTNLKKESKSDYYLKLNKIITESGKIYAPLNIKGGKVILSFLISSAGELIEEPAIIEASDNKLKPFAIEAVKKASPFPAFPEDIKEPEQRFSVTLDYA